MRSETLSRLFDSAFLRRLEQLMLRVNKVFRSVGRGDRRSRRRGESPEFSDHRAYHHGDDIRRIDWAAYARLEGLFLKQHAAEQDLVVHLLMDCSASMGIAEKFDHARRVAAAFVYLALASGDRVRVQAFADGRMGQLQGPLRGKRSFNSVLDFLAGLATAGETSLSDTVRRFCARAPTPGLVLVVTDLLDPAGYEHALKRLRYTRYEPLVLHILSKVEAEPPLSGDHDLTCVETGRRLSLTLDRTARKLYREKLAAFLEGVTMFCRRHGIAYALARDDEELEPLFFQTMRAAGFFM